MMALMDGEEMDRLRWKAEAYDEMRQKASSLEAKVDQLIDENAELRGKLEVPDGWDADSAPTYADLCEHLQAALQANAGLREELWMYYYHSHEEGKKKPTYKEWQGEAVRLRGRCRQLEDEIQRLKEEVDGMCEDFGEEPRYGTHTSEPDEEYEDGDDGPTYNELTDEERAAMARALRPQMYYEKKD